MRKEIVCLLALAAAPSLFALNNRSAVSLTGLDSNPCTVASPCRSFVAAMAATAADGEIIALASGGYGPFTIDKGITISGIPGVHAAITATSGDAITINAASPASINIRNMVILNSGAGANGIRINTNTNVRIVGCTLRGFAGQGAENFAGTMTLDHSVVMNNGVGVSVSSIAPGSGTVQALILNSLIEGNNVATYGGQDTRVVISHSTVSLNADGIHVESTGAGTFASQLSIDRSNVSENQNNGIAMFTDGTNTAVAFISETLFENTGTPVYIGAAGCTAYSFGNNEFVGTMPAVTPIALK